jgi:filamentous hemagglutinin
LIKTHDWDDALRDSNSEFDAKNYASDSPDGYMSAVDEVVEAQDTLQV